MVVPCVAIGGITVQNAPALIEAGADFVAVSAGRLGISRRPGSRRVKAFNGLLFLSSPARRDQRREGIQAPIQIPGSTFRPVAS